MAGRNLLVVDWDYFFPNPLEGGFDDPGLQLYDWGHKEAVFFIYDLWTIRAAAFMRSGLPLPSVNDEWREFSSRFTLADGARVQFADSNMWAGNLEDEDGEPFEEVWLYDAHHDAGYGVSSFPEWLGKAARDGEGNGVSFSCEDWMLVHYMQGTGLSWRWPRWHRYLNEKGSKPPEGVVLDAKRDDGEPVDTEFHEVFICRSGAWVPPWEDAKFSEFLLTWDADIEQLDEHALPYEPGREGTSNMLMARDWDEDAARAQVEQMEEMVRKANMR